MLNKYKKLGIDRLEALYETHWPGVLQELRALSGEREQDDPDIRAIVDSMRLGFNERELENTAALASYLQRWLKSRQAYDIDEELSAFLTIGESESVPMQFLEKLPYSSIYVNAPFCDDEFGDTEGFLAVREGDQVSLLFLASEEEMARSDNAFARCVVRFKKDKTVTEVMKKNRSDHRGTRSVAHAIAILLYIVSEEADVETVYNPNARTKNWKKNKAKSTKAKVSRVGWKIGREIGAARRRYEAGKGRSNDSRSVSPHVRRAHWHAYWLGPKDDPTDLVIHWIPPVFVKGGYPKQGVIHRS